MQGALPPAPPASPRNSRGATPCQAINFDIFRHIEREYNNRREYEKIGRPIPDNIDASKSSENITLVDKDIREAYREIFGEALEKYNGKQKRADLQTENGTLRGQIRSLTAQLDQIKGELWGMINDLRDKLRGAYESLTNVVKATGMLKYDREKDANGNYTYGKYGISNLSKAQEKLIDGLAEYGAKWAREDGFPEMAEEMEKRVGISKGIEKIIEPPAPKRSHYHDGPEL